MVEAHLDAFLDAAAARHAEGTPPPDVRRAGVPGLPHLRLLAHGFARLQCGECAFEPDVLLMDEPFGALDAQNRRIMQNEVRRIWKETGRTILFVTHSIEEAVAIGTTLLMLSARPSRVRELIRNDGRVDRVKLVGDLNTMIVEEVERQQGAS